MIWYELGLILFVLCPKKGLALRRIAPLWGINPERTKSLAKHSTIYHYSEFMISCA